MRDSVTKDGAKTRSQAQTIASQNDQGVPWLPNFCAIDTIGAVIVVTEIVVLIVLLAPDSGLRLSFRNFLMVSAFGQWLSFCIIAALCKSRAWLAKQSRSTSYAVAFVMICLIAAAGSALVHYLDQGLELGIAPQSVSTLQFVLSISAVTALVSIAALRYFELQQRNASTERAQANAQLIALQARIRPHFLFNTLNTIASLIRVRPNDAEMALEDLSELMRAALKSEAGMSTFAAQRELCERYLAIETLRMRERLQVKWLVSALPDDLPMPDFILQPLLENAILHGISPRLEGGLIEIKGERLSRAVQLQIINPKPPVGNALHRGNGTALPNIRARLEHHYGQAAQLAVIDAADYHSVTMTIPLP